MSYQNYKEWKTTPLSHEPVLSIIVPTRNEQDRIVPTIGAIVSHVSDLTLPWELIITDYGSRDQTVPLVQELEFANTALLRLRRVGKGYAIKQGMLAAKGKYILVTNADNSIPIEEMAKLMKKVQHEGYDIAIGNRNRTETEQGALSLIQHTLNQSTHWMVQNLFHIPAQDILCDFKMYTQEAARGLYSRLTMADFSSHLETVYLAAKFGYKIAEVPVNWIQFSEDEGYVHHKSRQYLRDLLRIKMNDLRGRYA
jgi:dolichyl-phosphate beta-glucosyltransferase